MSTFKLYREGKDYAQAGTKKLRAWLKKTAPLVAFDFEQLASGDHWVSISTPELTCICPFTDYPDFGSVKIEYVPNKVCLELKSFKLYINAFRDVKIFHEAVTEVIFADFLGAIKPEKARIEVDMNVRGNVKTVCRKYYKVNILSFRT
ncbi:preQ(1) synthase [Candidatus Peregrinibacteria bacterium]|nr:preQ(1) synthase [Candidatus Peregrinibacteria bacterium]